MATPNSVRGFIQEHSNTMTLSKFMIDYVFFVDRLETMTGKQFESLMSRIVVNAEFCSFEDGTEAISITTMDSKDVEPDNT